MCRRRRAQAVLLLYLKAHQIYAEV